MSLRIEAYEVMIERDPKALDQLVAKHTTEMGLNAASFKREFDELIDDWIEKILSRRPCEPEGLDDRADSRQGNTPPPSLPPRPQALLQAGRYQGTALLAPSRRSA